MVKIDPQTDALFIVDVQNDFCPGGALAIPQGDEVIPPLNQSIRLFKKQGALIYSSRDWHPQDSTHFAAGGGKWPPHCIKDSEGAKFHPSLNLPPETRIISKGVYKDSDGYSCFDGELTTVPSEQHLAYWYVPLLAQLRWKGVKRLFIGGLATDYCVKATALDALKNGFEVFFLYDCCRAMNLNPDDGMKAVTEMTKNGSHLILSGDFVELVLERAEERERREAQKKRK